MALKVNPFALNKKKNHRCKLHLDNCDDLVNTPGLIRYELAHHQSIKDDWSDHYFLIELLEDGPNKEVVKMLLIEGCRAQNLTKKTFQNWPLHFAILHRDMNVVRLILARSSLRAINHKNERLLEFIYYTNDVALIDYMVSVYIKEGIFPKDSNGLSLFHIACRFTPRWVESFPDWASTGINDRVIANTYNCCVGWSPLHFAINGNHFNTVRLLLEKGADFRVRDGMGFSAFECACRKHNAAMVFLFLAKDDFRLGDNYPFEDRTLYNVDSYQLLKLFHRLSAWSELHLAIAKLNIVKFNILLNEGADVNEPNVLGLSPLHLVYFSHYSDMVLSVASDVQQLENYLCLQTNMARTLLEAGARVNVADKFGKTALHYLTECYCRLAGTSSSTKQYIECNIALLLEHGADVTTGDFYGRTVLHYLAVSCTKGIEECYRLPMCEIFLSKGVDVDVATRSHETPLCLAIEHGLLQVARYLLTRNADIHYSCHEYKYVTPLCALVNARVYANAKHDFLRLMLSKEADPNAVDSDGASIMHHALQSGNEFDSHASVNVASILLEYGARFDARDKSGRTPLHVALFDRYHPGLVNILDEGADINAEDNYGDTPITLFVKKSQEHHNPNYFRWSSRVIELIVNRVKEMVCLGLHVSQKNMAAVTETLLSHYERGEAAAAAAASAPTKWAAYGDKCQREIQELKQVRLDHYNSLYDVLFKSAHKMATHVNNDALRSVLYSYDFNERFKVYGGRIKRLYISGLQRKKLLDPTYKIMRLLTELPDSCIDSTSRYLSNADLKNVIWSQCAK